ncbi:hypothetical protein C2E23DRAFT_743604, partial [Lenzites betulinus]
RPVTVEEVADVDTEEGGLPRKPWIEDYPGSAGRTEGSTETPFEHQNRERKAAGDSLWAPFKDEHEWQLAQWLVTSGLAQADIDKFLKLKITRERTKPSFESNYMFYKKIDALPTGEASWKVELLEAVGDVVGEDGSLKKETVEVWSRNPVDCVRELMGNPAFRDSIRYAPERQYTDAEGKNRIYGNMGTANWWWDIQARMPSGATVAPVILASDKTSLSRMSGDKSAWPGYRLFHLCMTKILEPLVAAGRDGVLMTCPDGRIRRVYPILAAYIADHPEQCLVAACQENHCPKCPIGPNERGEPSFSSLKDPARVTAILKRAAEGRKPPEFSQWGLRAVVPFWTDLPHADIFSALTPDILHQLHKGIFKDHLVSWATQAIDDGSNEVDRRFKAMLKHSDLRHFNKGISLVSQWTGTEYKNMEKVFLGIVAGAGDERVTRTVRAILDFIYYAHFETHTDASLDALHTAWKDYHKYKTVFVELEIRQHFNFPKGHSTEHYEPSIRSLGTADGYNTEHPERLHIDFAKLAYGASNKQSTYIEQMTRWLQRQEAVHRFGRYLAWAAPFEPSSEPATSAPLTTAGQPAPLMDNSGVDGPGEWQNGYLLAKEPGFPSHTARRIIDEFGAVDFKHALADYVKKLATSRRVAIITTPIHDYMRVPAYKQFKVQLPTVSQVTKSTLVDIIHASPPHPATRLLKLPVPANMSTVFAREPGSPPLAPGVTRLRVARVRVIFNLPTIYDARALGITTPLAFVEWFTPFHVVDDATGMYVVSPSTRQRQRYTSVIPISDIVRSCHLIPIWGKQIQRRVTVGDVLDNVALKFFVNPYLRHHDFVMLRWLGNI